MSLQASARLAARDLDVRIEVVQGETLAVLGPNGAGKSSVLAVLAGLVVPDTGRAHLDGRTLFSVDQADSPHVWVPPHGRHIALLAQEPLLFPHLSVVDNVAFGPRAAGVSRAEARAVAAHWLAEVDAGDWAQRKPAQLSGGQAQRVAVARALATEPDLLLLDEPLASLDVDVATAMRQTLRRVLADRTAIVVTHDALDTALLADRVAILEAGHIVETGATATVMRQPRSAFAAGLFGLNLIEGTAVGPDSLRSATDQVVVGESEPSLRAGETAIAVFRPHAVSVHRDRPSGSPRNVFTGAITAMEPVSHHVRVRMADLSADITPASVAELDLAVGVTVHFAVKAAEVALYSA